MIKKCCICGKEFEPKRKSQVTCLDSKCRRTRYRERNTEHSRDVKFIHGVDKRTYKREKAREYRARAKGKEYIPFFERESTEPTRNADDYAERQRQKLLKRAGRIKTTL